MESRPLIISCGILKREIECLVRKNLWDAECVFLPSTLHFDFDSLENGLTTALARHPGRHTVVVYGTCHPHMERFIHEGNSYRIPCQNCIEMLLGHDLFTKELASGAYFLLEEWAQTWGRILEKTFGNATIARDIFQEDRKYLLALRLPCSGDFTTAAEAAARSVGLPLRTLEVSTDHLEQLLTRALTEDHDQP